MKTRTATLAAALAVLLLAVAAVASGCGSASSSDDGVAALEDTTATTTDDEEQDGDETEDDPQEAALAWAKCMRENGVDVPDPEVDADGGRITIRPGSGARRLDRIDSEKFQEAQKKCGMPLRGSGRPVLSDEEREEMEETMLEFAQCMREHGVDMPDPDFSGSGGGVLFRSGGPGRFDRDNETFRKAQEACGEILEDALPGRAGAGTSVDGDGK